MTKNSIPFLSKNLLFSHTMIGTFREEKLNFFIAHWSSSVKEENQNDNY